LCHNAPRITATDIQNVVTPNERREFMYSLMDDKNLKQNLKTGKLGDAKTRIKVLFDLWVKPYGVYANSN